MSRYKELLAEYDRMPQYLEEQVISTKSDLLAEIKVRKTDILCALENSNRHTTSYYKVMEELLEQFEARIKKTVLPKRLEDWWRYSFEITHRGIMLTLEHIQSAFVNEEETEYSDEVVDQIFPLVFVRAKMLTVDEYAKLYEIEPVTVRQWIRRCKLRTVEKAGKEWRISVLTDVPKRGFESAQYRWWTELPNVPEGLEYVNDYKLATIVKSGTEELIAIFSEAAGPNSKVSQIRMTTAEREQLETFFIGNPLVEYASESMTFNHKKKKEPEIDFDDEEDS